MLDPALVGSINPSKVFESSLENDAMPYDGLRAFVDTLAREGELVRIGREVDPNLEIAEIADRTMKAGGPALLFERVAGSSFPLLINAYGSRRRMALALGVDDLE